MRYCDLIPMHYLEHESGDIVKVKTITSEYVVLQDMRTDIESLIRKNDFNGDKYKDIKLKINY